MTLGLIFCHLMYCNIHTVATILGGHCIVTQQKQTNKQWHLHIKTNLCFL